MTTPALPLVQLSQDEADLVGFLTAKLRSERPALDLSDAFYRAEQVVEDLGISIPPELSDLHTVCGWGAAAVDPLEERLDPEGFRYPGAAESDDELWGWWQDNDLDEESHLGQVDFLALGRSLVSVGSGDGGPNEIDMPPLIAVESPLDLTTEWDARARWTTSALRLYTTPGGEQLATLYLPGETISLAAGSDGWDVVDRDPHRLGVVPVVRAANRQRTADRSGAPETTTAVRSLIASCCRTLLGLETSREFYAAPRRYVLGASEKAFQDENGRPVDAWEAYAGKVWGLTRDEEGELPQVGQFAAHDPTAFTRIVEQYARLMASETGLPPGYLGIATDQPASADAIRQAENRLVKRAERRQKVLGGAWENVMRLSLLVQTGTVPEQARRLETVWRDASTPTRAAQTDAAVKLVAAGVVPADSPVAAEVAGLSPSQVQRIGSARRRSSGASALDRIAARVGGGDPAVEPAPAANPTAPA